MGDRIVFAYYDQFTNEVHIPDKEKLHLLILEHELEHSRQRQFRNKILDTLLWTFFGWYYEGQAWRHAMRVVYGDQK